MSTRRRDPLQAVRRAHYADKMARACARMTPEETRAAMVRMIRNRIAEDGDSATVSLDDFRRANLPMDQVPGLFKSALSTAQNGIALDREQ